MKKFLSIILITSVIITSFVIKGFADTNETTIVLQAGNPIMTINGNETEIDAGIGTMPMIQNGRTLVPVRVM